jgi:hypothetical protein
MSELNILRFGKGRLVISTGTYGGEPAAFIQSVENPGEVGTSAQYLGLPLDRMPLGSTIMVFPTMTQANIVADAITGSPGPKWELGQRLRKIRGSSWQGKVVGYYTTELTPIGYAIESEREPGSVQIYPESALEEVNPERT